MSTPHRFRPGGWDALEERVVLSPTWRPMHNRVALTAWQRPSSATQAADRPLAIAARRPTLAPAPRIHQTPAVVIDQEYAAFEADIAKAAVAYFANLRLGAAGSQTIALTLTAPYAPGSGVFAVGSLDFPPPSTEQPLLVAALVPGSAPRLYQATGAGGGLLTGIQPFNPTTGGFGGEGATDQPLPAGTALEAQIPFSQAVVNDVANQYRTYVSQRTLTLSRDLVSYFNRLPIRLPRVPGPYHTHRPQTAIQFYIANQIAGQGPQLLLQQLLSLPLPTSTGSAVDLYVGTTSSVIESSRQQLNEGIRLLFAGRDVLGVGRLTPAIPGQP